MSAFVLSREHKDGFVLLCRFSNQKSVPTAALVVFYKNRVRIWSPCPIDRAGNFWYNENKQENPKKTERRWVRCTASRQVIFTAVCRAVSSTRLLPEHHDPFFRVILSAAEGSRTKTQMKLTSRTDRQPAIRAYFYARRFVADE